MPKDSGNARQSGHLLFSFMSAISAINLLNNSLEAPEMLISSSILKTPLPQNLAQPWCSQGTTFLLPELVHCLELWTQSSSWTFHLLHAKRHGPGGQRQGNSFQVFWEGSRERGPKLPTPTLTSRLFPILDTLPCPVPRDVPWLLYE